MWSADFVRPVDENCTKAELLALIASLRNELQTVIQTNSVRNILREEELRQTRERLEAREREIADLRRMSMPTAAAAASIDADPV